MSECPLFQCRCVCHAATPTGRIRSTGRSRDRAGSLPCFTCQRQECPAEQSLPLSYHNCFPTRSGLDGNRICGRKLCIHLNRNDPLVATRSGCELSSIFFRKMVADSDQSPDQPRAQTRPIGAQDGRHQRVQTDGNPRVVACRWNRPEAEMRMI